MGGIVLDRKTVAWVLHWLREEAKIHTKESKAMARRQEYLNAYLSRGLASDIVSLADAMKAEAAPLIRKRSQPWQD